jgi:hypothetical protein
MDPRENPGAAPERRVLLTLAVLCFAHARFFALRYASQVPLDQFSFRQTQTALTAYWMVHDGFRLAYETPVAGPPWSIPFEFPLYQALVAAATRVLHLPLDVAGRVTSFVFLALTLLPARRITRTLGLAPAVFPVFAALLLSSPLYLYWGRSFMMETTAVFLTAAGIACYLDLREPPLRWRAVLGFVVFMALAMLQKVTTALPVLGVLAIVQAVSWIGGFVRERRLPPPGPALAIVVAFAVPVALGLAWTIYADQVKQLNLFGQSLTSSALSAWNWGVPADRLDAALYRDVLWSRLFVRNLGGVLGVAVLVAALAMRRAAPVRRVAWVALVLGVLPLLLFSPLHLHHDYYQSGNLVFLLFALAVALGDLVPARLASTRWDGRPVVAVLALALVASNLYWFRTLMWPDAAYEFTTANSRDMAIGVVLAKALPPDGQFVAFGNDWSSTFAYVSGRKSLGVAGIFPRIDEALAAPERFVEPGKLGAVVSCPNGSAAPSTVALESWAKQGRDWTIVPVADCVIAMPATAVAAITGIAAATAAPSTIVPPLANEVPAPAGPITPAMCEGYLDMANPTPDGTAFDVLGWTTVSGRDGVVPDQVWVTLGIPGSPTKWFAASPIARPDVSASFDRGDDPTPMGFRAAVPLDGLAGEVAFGVVRRVGDRLQACPMQLKATVPTP